MAALAGQVFAEAEQAYLARLDAAARADCVLRYWTRKEAVLKATGDGLNVDPAAVILAPPDQPPRLIGWPGHPAERPMIALHDLSLHKHYAASLAVLGVPPSNDVPLELIDAGSRLWSSAARDGLL